MTDPMGHTLSDLVRWMCEVATARLPGRPRTVVLTCTKATLQQWLDRVQQALTRHDALLTGHHISVQRRRAQGTRFRPEDFDVGVASVLITLGIVA